MHLMRLRHALEAFEEFCSAATGILEKCLVHFNILYPNLEITAKQTCIAC